MTYAIEVKSASGNWIEFRRGAKAIFTDHRRASDWLRSVGSQMEHYRLVRMS